MKLSMAKGKSLGACGILLLCMVVSSAFLLTTIQPVSAEEPMDYCTVDSDYVDNVVDFSQELLDYFLLSKKCKKDEDFCEKLRGKGATREIKKRRIDAAKALLENANDLIALDSNFYGTAAILLDTLYQRCDGLGRKEDSLGDWLRGPAKDSFACGLDLLIQALYEEIETVTP